MKKSILIALFCVSLMLITPLTVVAQENKIRSIITENPVVDRFIAQINNRINDNMGKYENKPNLPIILDFIRFLLKLVFFPLQFFVSILRFILAIILSPVFLIGFFILYLLMS
jgi:hypothetical protein